MLSTIQSNVVVLVNLNSMATTGDAGSGDEAGSKKLDSFGKLIASMVNGDKQI